jgi:hypothetical protein
MLNAESESVYAEFRRGLLKHIAMGKNLAACGTTAARRRATAYCS